jgi:hypothetical protein
MSDAADNSAQMQTLTIKARTLESARGFVTGLAGFNTELDEADDGSYLVQITLGGPDSDIIAVLNALEDYVTNRSQEPAEVGLAGRTYELHPTDPPRITAEAVPA